MCRASAIDLWLKEEIFTAKRSWGGQIITFSVHDKTGFPLECMAIHTTWYTEKLALATNSSSTCSWQALLMEELTKAFQNCLQNPGLWIRDVGVCSNIQKGILWKLNESKTLSHLKKKNLNFINAGNTNYWSMTCPWQIQGWENF